VPTSLLIAPGLWTIQFLFRLEPPKFKKNDFENLRIFLGIFFVTNFFRFLRAFLELRSSAEQLVRPGITPRNASFLCFEPLFVSCYVLISLVGLANHLGWKSRKPQARMPLPHPAAKVKGRCQRHLPTFVKSFLKSCLLIIQHFHNICQPFPFFLSCFCSLRQRLTLSMI
jgi:hypothetical protein